MKKIYALSALCLGLGCASASAQTFTVSDAPIEQDGGYTFAPNTHWYQMQLQLDDIYLSTANKDREGLLLNVTDSKGTDHELWCVVGDETNGYRFYNKAAGAGKILGMVYQSGSDENTNNGGASRAMMIDYRTDEQNSTTLGETGFIFLRQDATASGYDLFYLKGSEQATKYYWNARGNYLAYWVTSLTPGQRSAIKFTEGDEYTIALETANQKLAEYGGNTTAFFDADGSVYTALNTAYTKNQNVTGADAQATATKELDAALTKFRKATERTQVVIGNYRHTSLYMRAKDKRATETSKTEATGYYLGAGSLKNNYRYLFTLVKEEAFPGLYALYSDFYGKYAAAVPSSDNTEFTLQDEPHLFTIKKQSHEGFYAIYDEPNTSTSSSNTHIALNMADWRSNTNYYGNGIVRWTKEGDASQFSFSSEIPTAEWDAALEAEAAKVGETIGTYRSSEALTTALEAFKNASAKEKGVKARELEEALRAAAILPEAGKYYTIGNATTAGEQIVEAYGATDAEASTLKSQAAEANIMPGLWKFEGLNNSDFDFFSKLYTVTAANSGSLMAAPAADAATGLVASGATGVGQYEIALSSTDDADAAVTLTHYADAVRATGTTLTADANGNLTAAADAAAANKWQIAEVTSVPVTIGTTGYATLYLPCAVTIPDGVRAYTGQDGENEVVLTEVQNVIPAETAVILYTETPNTEFNFDILYDNTDAAVASSLNGTLVPATVAADATAYILYNGSEGIGMYKVTDETHRTIPANKAYLGSTQAASGAAMKAFNFGQATGIGQAATTDAAANTYFDLQGRRVLFPAHGIYVKGNGQKVYIR